MTVDAPLTYTSQFGPFVRHLQHTNDEWGGRWRTRKPFKRIFVPMTLWTV